MGGDDSSHLIRIGAEGSFDGTPWDEKGNTEVVQIFLSHHREDIKTIQFQYHGENGNLVLSPLHGTNNHAPKFTVVRLNYPHEYITGISGQTTNTHVRSITFRSNLGEYGPYGPPLSANPDKEFDIRLGEDRQFGGFHGTSDEILGLKSIGVYLKPIMKYPPKQNITEPTQNNGY